MRKSTIFLTAPLALALMGSTAMAAGADGAVKMKPTTDNSAATTMDNSSTSTTGGMATGATANGNVKAGMSTDTNAAKSAGTDKTMKTDKGDTADARDIVNGAVKVVDQMKSDQDVARLLKKAKGVYIVPDFGRGGFIVGGRGGAGVMLAKHDGKWTDPAFFDFGGVSVGAQAGGSGGSVAFILMSRDAVNAFKSGNQFSLNGGAGLSIVNYSANAQTSAGKGDIVFWSDTEGAYAGATISVSDISWADDNNRGYYGKKVSPKKLIGGQVAAKKGQKLKTALQG